MQYVPGQCNINRGEIARRYWIGVAGIVLTVLTVVAIGIFDLPRLTRLVVVIPLGISAAGFVQAVSKFCLAFGFLGVFSSPGPERVQRSVEAEAQRLDRLKAVKLLTIIVIIAVVITLAYYNIP